MKEITRSLMQNLCPSERGGWVQVEGFILRGKDESDGVWVEENEIVNTHFHGQDSEENYLTRCDSGEMPDYYVENFFEYNLTPENLRNEQFRLQQLINDKQKRFLVALGDSQTFGTGSSPNDLYHFYAAEGLGLQNFNFGIPGTNLDVALVNSIALVEHGCRPAVVVIQHSEISRRLKCYKHTDRDTAGEFKEFVTFGIEDNFSTEELLELVEQGDITDFFQKAQTAFAVDAIWNSVNVPVVHITFGNDGTNRFYKNIKNFNAEDTVNPVKPSLARDFSHDGPAVHERAGVWIANTLRPFLKEK